MKTGVSAPGDPATPNLRIQGSENRQMARQDPMETPSEDEEDSACIGEETRPEITSVVHSDSTDEAKVYPPRWE